MRSHPVAASAWSHPSIRGLRVPDPVEWVTSRARDLAYEAIEAGWAGPPFDPTKLAEMLGLEVTPRQDVLDARLVPASRGARIEFNPNRSAGRIRYSIAHEIGHALFPDHAETARHRLSGIRGSADAELEVLCNLAAAEILMPIGSFPELAVISPSIDMALALRQRYDLSMEAVLLRMARLTVTRTTAFAAVPLGDLIAAGYRLDYAVASRGEAPAFGRGYRLPNGSVVEQCTAIGYTAKSVESWPGVEEPTEVEAVGIPPYPGHVLPRVAGLLLLREAGLDRQSITYLVGDATEPRGRGPRIIVQVVNDATPRWGGRFARQIRKRWPSVQGAFIEWANGRPPTLGMAHVARAEPDISVASVVAQHGYGVSARARIRYHALESGLEQVATEALNSGAAIHAPRIGAGEAGGNWTVVAELIDRAFVSRGISVTVYDPPSAIPSPGASDPHQLQLTLR